VLVSPGSHRSLTKLEPRGQAYKLLPKRQCFTVTVPPHSHRNLTKLGISLSIKEPTGQAYELVSQRQCFKVSVSNHRNLTKLGKNTRASPTNVRYSASGVKF
jgi:hypothetical protein